MGWFCGLKLQFVINDKILLREGALIEIINDELNKICQVEHSRLRSETNFFSDTTSGLIAYTEKASH